MKSWSTSILLACLALAVSTFVPPSIATAQIALNEVLADPASDWDGDGTVDPKGDEWVEIINLGDATVDLADYWLRDDSSRLPDYGLSGQLAPGAVRIVFGSEVIAWQHERGWLETGFGFNNSGGDRAFLLYGPYSEELAYEILEQIWIGSHEADDDRSSGRDPVTGEWVLFDGLNPYHGTATPQGTGCEPSPAVPNICQLPVADQQTSFGQLKAIFR